ncbi:HlyD family secretion protein [Erythrobacter rubeus]|uniref:HlyD family efflux transporter periplasmic adaptor subunit n=1 Tax=Erythrobacter rubeus TaxID=2760803 RepID=A0ABR8KL48_9SPHN|nr:HlyD family efflux transporter periplasmic adaptor subunit [Erythrobacter rubeus]MBD2841082.1 HlyD family efflux transporter periplasmic adaptor subunit [Erythrobacter rubeus]
MSIITPTKEDLSHFTTLQQIRTPLIMRTVYVLVLAAIVILVGFLIFVPWVQTTGGQGVVTTLNPNERQQEINALVSGRIEEWYVRDGSAVQKGDPIARIADIDPRLVERLQAERQQVQIQLQSAQNALATAQIDERRMAELFAAGLTARRDFEQAQIRVEEMRGRVAEAQANLTRAETALSRQSEQLVVAPRDGFIQSVNAGDAATLVSAGDVLASFVPETTERVIEIFVDGRDVGLIQPGEEARVQFEGWPAVQFSGWPSVAIGTFAGKVTTVDQSAQADGRFRVLIAEDPEGEEPWPEERYARFGASVRAWVLLETVPVGYEIWRQLNNFPPELPPAPDTQGQAL